MGRITDFEFKRAGGTPDAKAGSDDHSTANGKAHLKRKKRYIKKRKFCDDHNHRIGDDDDSSLDEHSSTCSKETTAHQSEASKRHGSRSSETIIASDGVSPGTLVAVKKHLPLEKTSLLKRSISRGNDPAALTKKNVSSNAELSSLEHTRRSDTVDMLNSEATDDNGLLTPPPTKKLKTRRTSNFLTDSRKEFQISTPTPKHDKYSMYEDHDYVSDADDSKSHSKLRYQRRLSQSEYSPYDSYNSQIEKHEGNLEPTPQKVRREIDVNLLQRIGQIRREERDAKRFTDFKDLDNAEYKLFATIDQRGFEAFLPLIWHLDFPVKEEAYYGQGPDTTHINSSKFTDPNANFRGMRAFRDLIETGPIVRDRYGIMHRRPEPLIASRIRSYMAWADRDAGFSNQRFAPPLLALAFDNKRDGTGKNEVLAALERRMLSFAKQWRSWQANRASASNLAPKTRKGLPKAPEVNSRFSTVLGWMGKILGKRAQLVEEYPVSEAILVDSESKFAVNTVYGIAVCHLVVAILSLRIDPCEDKAAEFEAGRTSKKTLEDTAHSDRRSARMLFYVDFAKPEEDVWNAVALAMAVCHCRDLRLTHSVMLNPITRVSTDDE